MYFLYFNRCLRTNSVSSANFARHESMPMSMSPRSSSPMTGWSIQYKTIRETESKGVWSGYQTREDFMMMHLR